MPTAQIIELFPIDRNPDAQLERVRLDIKAIEAMGADIETQIQVLRDNAKGVLDRYYKALDEQDYWLRKIAFDRRVRV